MTRLEHQIRGFRRDTLKAWNHEHTLDGGGICTVLLYLILQRDIDLTCACGRMAASGHCGAGDGQDACAPPTAVGVVCHTTAVAG